MGDAAVALAKPANVHRKRAEAPVDDKLTRTAPVIALAGIYYDPAYDIAIEVVAIVFFLASQVLYALRQRRERDVPPLNPVAPAISHLIVFGPVPVPRLLNEIHAALALLEHHEHPPLQVDVLAQELVRALVLLGAGVPSRRAVGHRVDVFLPCLDLLVECRGIAAIDDVRRLEGVELVTDLAKVVGHVFRVEESVDVHYGYASSHSVFLPAAHDLKALRMSWLFERAAEWVRMDNSLFS